MPLSGSMGQLTEMLIEMPVPELKPGRARFSIGVEQKNFPLFTSYQYRHVRKSVVSLLVIVSKSLTNSFKIVGLKKPLL